MDQPSMGRPRKGKTAGEVATGGGSSETSVRAHDKRVTSATSAALVNVPGCTAARKMVNGDCPTRRAAASSCVATGRPQPAGRSKGVSKGAPRRAGTTAATRFQGIRPIRSYCQRCNYVHIQTNTQQKLGIATPGKTVPGQAAPVSPPATRSRRGEVTTSNVRWRRKVTTNNARPANDVMRDEDATHLTPPTASASSGAASFLQGCAGRAAQPDPSPPPALPVLVGRRTLAAQRRERRHPIPQADP